MRSDAALTEARVVEIVFPDHCKGTAKRTARSDRIDFRRAVRLGEIVELVATVVGVGRSSMTVRVNLSSEATPGAPPMLATSGEFVMVAVDDAGHAVAVDRSIA